MANQIDPSALRASHDDRLGVDPAESTFAALVAQQTEVLERQAFRLTRNRAEAADLLQDTVEKALRNWRRFAPGSRLRAWLLTIMTHLFVDRCRRRGREIELDEDIEQPAPEVEEVAPIWTRLTDEQVRRALDALDPGVREVYQMRAVHRLSYQSMSARLGIPVGTVGTRLNRARLKLRSLLESELADAGKEQR